MNILLTYFPPNPKNQTTGTINYRKLIEFHLRAKERPKDDLTVTTSYPASPSYLAPSHPHPTVSKLALAPRYRDHSEQLVHDPAILLIEIVI